MPCGDIKAFPTTIYSTVQEMDYVCFGKMDMLENFFVHFQNNNKKYDNFFLTEEY